MQIIPIRQLLIVVLLMAVTQYVSAKTPKILTSIKPLQFIAQAITEGITDVDVLLPPGTSPHNHLLKPSDTRKLKSANIFFWIGPTMETFLPKVLASTKDIYSVPLIDIQGLRLLNNNDDERHIHTHDQDEHHHGYYDPHIWLSTDNARVIATEIAHILITKDEANKNTYQKNLNIFLKVLDQTDSRNDQKVAQSGKKPFFVFHNAYGYLQEQYGFEIAGYFTINPDRQPGARHLTSLKVQLDRAGPTCIFLEPQFNPSYIERLTEGISVKIGTLDPLAENIQTGPDSYATFINQLVDNITNCIQVQVKSTEKFLPDIS